MMKTVKSLAAVVVFSTGTLLAGQASAEIITVCTSYPNGQIYCTKTDGLTSYQRQMWHYNRKAQQDSAWERREKQSSHEYTGE
jgi:hypothetical protein